MNMDQHKRADQRKRRQFRIWVAGRLDEGFANGLDGRVEQHDTSEGTALTGDYVDQSHLHGILDHLRRLGVEVIRFEAYRPDHQ